MRWALACLAVIACAQLGCPRMGSCKPQEVNGLKTGCATGPAGYMWNGTSCVYTQACNCTGADCEGLYEKKDVCEAAHTHCL